MHHQETLLQILPNLSKWNYVNFLCQQMLLHELWACNILGLWVFKCYQHKPALQIIIQRYLSQDLLLVQIHLY